MEAKELRQNNLVRHNFNGIVKVNGIHPYGSKLHIDCDKEKEGKKAWRDISNFEPIELTEEWLLKLGFVNNNGNYEIDNEKYNFSMLYYDCWRISYKEKKGFGGSECYIEGFYHIHTLQNLFYSLTGEELTLNP